MTLEVDLGPTVRKATDSLPFRIALFFFVANAFGHVAAVVEPTIRLHPSLLALLLVAAAAAAWVRRAVALSAAGKESALRLLWGASREAMAPLVLLLSAYGIVIASGALYAQSPERSIDAFRGYVISAVELIAVVLLLVAPVALRWTALAIVLSALALSAVNLAQFATHRFDDDYLGFAQAVRETRQGVETFRVGGPFSDPNYFAQRLVVAIPLGVWLFRSSRAPATRVFAALGTLCSSVAVFATMSRGGLLVLGIVAAFLVHSIIPRRYHAGLWSILLVVAISSLALPAVREYIDSILRDAGGFVATTPDAVPGRAREWRVGIAM